jgi:hypothetical protein
VTLTILEATNLRVGDLNGILFLLILSKGIGSAVFQLKKKKK